MEQHELNAGMDQAGFDAYLQDNFDIKNGLEGKGVSEFIEAAEKESSWAQLATEIGLDRSVSLQLKTALRKLKRTAGVRSPTKASSARAGTSTTSAGGAFELMVTKPKGTPAAAGTWDWTFDNIDVLRDKLGCTADGTFDETDQSLTFRISPFAAMQIKSRYNLDVHEPKIFPRLVKQIRFH